MLSSHRVNRRLKKKSGSEVVEDYQWCELYKVATCHWSIQPSEFWNMTPQEWWHMYESKAGVKTQRYASLSHDEAEELFDMLTENEELE